MKGFYKWFDYFLNLLLVSIVLEVVVVCVLGMNNYNFSSNFFPTIESFFTIILFTSLIFSLLYIIIGISLLLVNRKLNNRERVSLGKSLLLRGVIRSIITFAFFFLLSFAESFFGLTLESTHIPVVGDPNSPDTGFPIKDLKIISRKQDAEDSTECDITIFNTNPTYSAANLSVTVDGNETVGASLQDHIAPGKTDIISVDAGAGPDTQHPCGAYIIINDAGIAKN